ncbi:type VII secretion system-associated protein [Streptomyces tendae]|uniref:type VII secretion system-associated protein n=1 Tax=Streptomyces tendae TaxID=1932 RepID=UPI00378A1078
MAATVLDSTFLKTFINSHIAEFRKALGAIVVDDPNLGPAVSSLLDTTTTTIDAKKPLRLGPMANADSVVNGDDLNTAIQKCATEVERILEAQGVLFEDIEQALWDTIEALAKTQDHSLQSIKPEDFMDLFEDVDSDLEPEDSDNNEEEK